MACKTEITVINSSYIKLFKTAVFRKIIANIFIRPSRDGPFYVIGCGGRPHRFPHDNFSSVFWIFAKLGHMIPPWKGKNPIYFGVIRSKVKVTITINRISDNRIVSAQ